MADPKKRDGANVAPEHDDDTVAAKKQKLAGEANADSVGEDDIFAWLTDFDADSIAELMSLLDPSTATAVQVRFADNPYSPPAIYHSSSFITINGNEETSGSSFSAVTETETLMVSFDTGGVPAGGIAGAWGTVPGCPRGGDSESASIAGAGGGEVDAASSCGELYDAMLARFLGEDLL